MGKKSKKPKKKALLDEVETVTYEQQIAEDNKQLARLRARNEELETEAENLKEKLAQLEENKADLTSHLQSVLDKKTQESDELLERLKALERQRKSEEAAAKKKELKMENDFKVMENNLTAELKLAAGKLSALEDFRQARIELMNKFEEQEKQMAEQEVRHKGTLYETKKQLIINKTNMQTELERRLLELSESFRAATELRMADATQRVVRENLALQRELNDLLEHCRHMNDLMEEYKEKERSLRLQSQLYDTETRLALNKLTKQTEMIEKLAADHRSMCEAIGKSHRAEQYAQRCEQLLGDARKSNAETHRKIRILEQQIERSREDVVDSAARTQDNFAEIERLTRILADAKQCIKDALMLQTEVENQEEYEACSTCCLDIKERLLHTLFTIFSAFETGVEDHEDQELEDRETDRPDDMYEFGNLGLIPTDGDDGSTLDKSDASSMRSILRTFCDQKASFNEPTLSDCSCADEQVPSQMSSRF